MASPPGTDVHELTTLLALLPHVDGLGYHLRGINDDTRSCLVTLRDLHDERRVNEDVVVDVVAILGWVPHMKDALHVRYDAQLNDERRKVYADAGVMGLTGTAIYGMFMLSPHHRAIATTVFCVGVAGSAAIYARHMWNAQKRHQAQVSLLEDVVQRARHAGVLDETPTVDASAWSSAISASIEPLYTLFTQADQNKCPLVGNEKYLILPGGEAHGL